jgi:Putative adhesin
VPRRLAYLLPIFLTLCSLLASAEEWRKTYALAGSPELSVDTNDGEIRIHASDRKDIEAVVVVTGEKIGPSGVRITENQQGNHVSLTVKVPNHWGIGWHRRSVRVEIETPREANLDLHSGDGNVRVLEVKGALHIETGDGDVEAAGTDGSLQAHTGDGNIRADGIYTALDLHTGDGSISAEAKQGSKMDSRWSLRSGDGNIELRLPDSFSAEVDAHTGDGHIELDFPVTVNGSVRESTIRGKINGGGRPSNCDPETGTLAYVRASFEMKRFTA